MLGEQSSTTFYLDIIFFMVISSTTVMVPEYTSLEIAMKLPKDFMKSVSFLAFQDQNFFFFGAVCKASHKAVCNPCGWVFPYIHALSLTFSAKYKRKLTLRL